MKSIALTTELRERMIVSLRGRAVANDTWERLSDLRILCVLPPLPEFEKHCNFRTDEEVRELMQQRSAPRQAPRRARFGS